LNMYFSNLLITSDFIMNKIASLRSQ
jgi:hypothetical protein